MRATMVWRRVLGVEHTVVESVELDSDRRGELLVARVRVTAGQALRCSRCLRRCPRYDRQTERRRWRGLDLGTVRTILEADTHRVRCAEHGVVVAHVPWARPGARFTAAFEDTTAWLVAHAALSTVAILLRIAWRSVSAIVTRVVTERPAVQTGNRSDPDHAPQPGLWARLAQMPALSVEGQRQVSRLSFGTDHQAMKVLLRRPDLDPEARQLVFHNVSEWTADDLVKEELCTTAEAADLLERFPNSTPLLVAALRRPDTRVVAQQRVHELSYDQAARLWDRWTSGPDLAEVLLPVILTKKPANRPVSGYQTEQVERSSLVASMLERLPAERRLEWLRNPEHGPLVRQTLLTGTNLSDSELLECLPEITKPAAIQAGDTPALVEYLHRHPRLIDLAKAELGAAVARLLADGWQPTQIARAGKWDVLVTVARLAETPGLIEDLARASVFDRRDPITTAVETERWHEPRRYALVDHLVNNTAASDKQITYILDRLVTSHVTELREVAPKRSRLNQLIIEVLRSRQPKRGPSPQRPEPIILPTDAELSTTDDPVNVLLELWRNRMPSREAVAAHILASKHVTDKLAWRLPIVDLVQHPVWGQRLASKVAEICSDSPARWEEFSRSWGQPSQLLADTLFKRLDNVND